MKKTLAEQDEMYRVTISEFSKEDRIEYCYSLIDKNQKILTNQGLELPKLKRLMISELIEAAQKEIQMLTGIKISSQNSENLSDSEESVQQEQKKSGSDE